jgi:anaerobic magnesium-protoporphyrin IX monomethyl ester cyclase
MMIALVNPGKNPEFATSEPLNIEYLAGYLEKNNFEVKIIDELVGQNVKKEINKFSPDIVGITSTTPVVLDAYRIADMCREKGILTVMGGVHVTALPEEALQHSDIVVKGEGESAMLDIINKEIKSGVISYPNIHNLDEIAMPARNLVDMDYYLRVTGNYFLHHTSPKTKTGAIITSRGCTNRCIFCHNSWRQIPLRFHSAERVVEEIKFLIENYGVEALFFMDDNLLLNKPRFKRICDLMKEEKIDITFACNSRTDTVDYETLQVAKAAGCREVSFGFESGSQRILNVLNKGTTVSQNKKAIQLCKKVGIMATGSFMIGNPTETAKDIRLTQAFIKENPLDFAGICITTPFPGTKLWEWCEQHNLIPEKVDWSKFAVSKLSIPCNDNFTREEILSFFNETDELISSFKRPIDFYWLMKMSVERPSMVLNMFSRMIKSKSLIKYVKRVKI